jgi:hypothetical protein
VSVEYRYHRVLPLPLVPDADPNVSGLSPDDEVVFKLQSRPPFGNTLTVSHALYFSLEGGAPGAAPAVSFRTWEWDELGMRWVAVTPGPVLAQDRVKLVGTGVQEARLFVQLIGVVDAGAATTIHLRLTEQGTDSNASYGGAGGGASSVVEGFGLPGLPVGGLLTVQGDPSGEPIPVFVTNPSSGGCGVISIQVNNEWQKYTVGMTEEVVAEHTIDFDALSSIGLGCRLTALTEQTGGASGDYRVRVGGTFNTADGTIFALLTTTNPAYALPPDGVVGPILPKPVGKQLVKVTARASIAGKLARIRGYELIFSA